MIGGSNFMSCTLSELYVKKAVLYMLLAFICNLYVIVLLESLRTCHAKNTYFIAVNDLCCQGVSCFVLVNVLTVF